MFSFENADDELPIEKIAREGEEATQKTLKI